MNLPIMLPKEISFLFTYAFPYTILSQANGAENLLLSSYLEPYMFTYKTGHLDAGYMDGFSYGEPSRLPDEYFFKQYVSADSQPDEFTIEKIQNRLFCGYYAIAFADEFYLPHREAYGKVHYVHEFLVYGINGHMVNTMALCENGLLGFPSFSITELLTAIRQGRYFLSFREGCPWINEQYILYLRANNSGFPKSADPDVIKHKIDAYFLGQGDKLSESKVMGTREFQGKTATRGVPVTAYGVNLPLAIRLHLQIQKEYLQADNQSLFEESYQRLHMFAEQYTVALHRAQSIDTYYNMEREKEYLARAARVAEAIRVIYLRCMLISEPSDTKLRLVNRMIDILAGL